MMVKIIFAHKSLGSNPGALFAWVPASISWRVGLGHKREIPGLAPVSLM